MGVRMPFVMVVLLGCGGRPTSPPAAPVEPASTTTKVDAPPSATMLSAVVTSSAAACGGDPLRVAFYNAGQGLAALVTLPTGEHILIDTGESSVRKGCGTPCKTWHEHVMQQLADDLGSDPIDLLWITHPHSDHLGGALNIIDQFAIKNYVDNGRDLSKPLVKALRKALKSKKIAVTVVAPGNLKIPLQTSKEVQLTAIVPDKWNSQCKTNANLCSAVLRIDYCSSSILFTGDAEHAEEAQLDVGGPVSLLQVGHHGSDTSTTADFLSAVSPKYAVISSGAPNEGTNRTYCHPRKVTVDALTSVLGGPKSRVIRSFDPGPSNVKCVKSKPKNWFDVPASDNLWATATDGDVVLTTLGDGTFAASSVE